MDSDSIHAAGASNRDNQKIEPIDKASGDVEKLEQLLEKIRRLELENQSLRRFAPKDGPGSPGSEQPRSDFVQWIDPDRPESTTSDQLCWKTIHRLERDKVFLVKPSINLEDNGSLPTRGELSPQSLKRYLHTHPEIAFLVFQDYGNDTGISSMTRRRATVDTTLEPVSESIELVSEGMRDAFSAVTRLEKFTFIKGSLPSPSLDIEIPAPYYFWYFTRSYGDWVQQLDVKHQPFIRLLGKYIEMSQGDKFRRVDTLLADGRIALRDLPFLMRPGEAVWVQTEAGPRGYITSALVKPSHTQNETGEKVVDYNYIVDAWSWAFDGKFTKAAHEIEVTWSRHSGGISDEVTIQSLKCYPLRYADEDITSQLKQMGEMYWSCRSRKLIEYWGDGDKVISDQDVDP
jgi:hypothetical protein